MNILFILTNYPGFGGIEKVTTYITSYLSKRGHSISILTYGSSAPQLIDSLPEWIPLIFVPDPQNYGSSMNSTFIGNYLTENEFDFVVLQDSYAPIEHFIKEIDYPWKDKLIVVEHNSPLCALWTVNSYFYNKSSWIFFLKTLIKYPFSACKAYVTTQKRHSFLFENCRKYVLLSDLFRSELKTLIWKLDEKKVTIINNPLTIPQSNKTYLNIKKRQILFVGRMSYQKGINFLLLIWEEFSKHNDEAWQLIILGDGPKYELETYIKNKKLKCIQIAAATTEIERYYEESAILVMTSIFEGFPLVLAEAMSRGCVPIAFDSFKSVHDIIVNKKNGILISPFKVKKYAKYLSKIVNDSDKRNLMANAAQRWARSLDIKSIGAKWERMLEEL